MKRRNFLQSARRKEYRRKRFRNPEASKIRKPRPWRLIFGILAFLIAVASIPFMLAYAPVFTFDDIAVEGLVSIPDEEVVQIVQAQTQKSAYKIFPQNNRFFFKDEVVFDELQKKYDFSNLEVVTEGKTVRIIAEERIVELVWLSGDNYYFLDLNGNILSELTEEERQQVYARLNNQPEPVFEQPVRKLLPSMPIVNDLQSESIEINQHMESADFVSGLIEIDKGLRRHGILPNVYELAELHSHSLRLKTHNGYDVLVSPAEDIQEQLNGLEVILSDYADRLGELEYIDLRFGSHVFIK